jgi:hypothetical protein
MRKSSNMTGLMVLFLLALSLTALAQQPVGSIEGNVTDQNGSVVSGARVTITEKATGRVINVSTSSEGYFIARALLPGRYSVRIEQQGFSPAVVEDLTVQIGQVASASVSLKVGNATATVEVSATTGAQVDTSRQTIDGVITKEQIEQLPLNARNFLDLARLEPGVMVRDGGSIDPTKENAYRTVGISGRGGTGTRVQFDGIDVTDETVGTTVANVSSDSISEFQLSRSSLDMSTSLTSSGAINIATKSGGNSPHGAVFYFGRNQSLSAKQAPSQQGDNDPFHRHQVGFNAGGPFVKDKLFWHVTWERFYQADNFVTDPASVTFFPQMAGNVQLPVGIRYSSARLDWNVGSSVRLFYRFNNSWDSSTGGSGQSPFQTINWTNVHAVGLDYTQARATHSYRFGYVNFNNNISSQEFSQFQFPVTGDSVPYFLTVGQFQQGPNNLAPQQTYQDNFQNKYDGSYVTGNHTLRYGGEINRIVLGGFANFAGPLTINGNFTSGPGGTRDQVIARGANPQDPLEYPFSSFSTGPSNGFFTIPAAHGFLHGGNYNHRFAFYVGDNWRVRRNLSLNFGTRWEYDTAFFNKEEEDGARRAAIIGQVHQPSLGAPKFPKDRFGPSFGFAWDPFSDGKTSIRGGFYLAYEMNIANNTIFNEFALIPPGIGPDSFGHTRVVGPDGTPINVDGAHPTGNYRDLENQPIKNVLATISKVHLALNAAYANHQFDPSQGQTLFEISQGNTIGGIFPGDFKIPYSLQFNIGFQHELWPGHVISVDYVRNRGVGLPYLLQDYESRLDASTFNAATASAGVASVLGGKTFDQFIADFPATHNGRQAIINDFGLANDTIYTGKTSGLLRARIMTGGYSLYQALQVKFQGRGRTDIRGLKNVNYQFSYAFGESLATCASGRAEFGGNTCDNLDINNKSYFGHTPFSLRHLFSGGAIFDTFGGVRLSTIVGISTRPPLTLNVPALGGISGANAFFSTDLNGDGGTGTTPRGDILPGVKIGDWGVGVSSIGELNEIIQAFNTNNAGKLTPHAQALVAAGIFTEAQLRTLRAVVPTIPLVPTDNPNPFASNTVNFDVRVSRPINIENAYIVKNLRIEPYFDAFNLFNRRALNSYSGLGAGFGSLNFNYAANNRLNDLRDSRAFRFGPRIIQFGFRVQF